MRSCRAIFLRILIGMSCLCLYAQGTKSKVSPASSSRAIQVQGAPFSLDERRIALVIGNGAYRNAPLANPVNDARSMAESLRRFGFSVTKLENASRDQMATALRDFGDQILTGGVGLFYYAGHGMQVRGKNFLIPVNADIQREDEVSYQAMDAEAILAKMETARNRLNIVILDACRNNPFGRSFRSGAQGLAQMDAPKGTFIAFSTAPGRIASDGTGRNGLYTRHLLDNLATPGLKLEDLFKRVRAGVLKDSAEQQMPWDSSSLMGDFYFVPTGTFPTAAPPLAVGTDTTGEASLEVAFWNSIKDSSLQADFEAYLKRFPGGTFADLARNRIADLNPSPAAPFPDEPIQGAYLGVVIQELNEDLYPIFGATEGALVTDIQATSPAQKAGLKPLDLITGLDGRKVSKPADVVDWVRAHRKGDKVRLQVLRERKTFEVTTTLASHSTTLIAAKEAPPLAESQQAPAELQSKAAALPQNDVFETFFATKTPYGFHLGVPTGPQRQGVQEGVTVTAVDDQGPAKAFLAPADVILAVLSPAGREPVKDPAGFLKAVRSATGKTLVLLVRRADRTFVLTMPVLPSNP
jgi:hypothetical protein